MARIVFDLDGTLIDSAPDLQGIANTILTRDGYDPITLDQTREFVGNGAAVFVEKMRAARAIPGAEQSRLLADFLGRYDDAVELTVPYFGVEGTLQTLAAAGHRLGVCTNKPHRSCLAVLRHLRLDRFFEIVFGGDSLPVHKPDPAPLHAAFDALGDGPRIYVGDSEVDAETARRAGIPFVLFTEGYRKTSIDALPHAVSFSDFTDLPHAIQPFVRTT